MKKVNEVSKELNITVRALHHYDQIGLVIPNRVNGIRYYSLSDIDLLRRVLFMKELGFSLKTISSIIKSNVPVEILRKKRDELIAKRNKINEVIAFIDSYSIIDRDTTSVEALKNPFAADIRHLIGDEQTNKILDSADFNPQVYVDRITSIMINIKDSLDDETKTNQYLGEYYDYMTEWLNINLSRPEFAALILEHLPNLDTFDEREKKELEIFLKSFKQQQ